MHPEYKALCGQFTKIYITSVHAKNPGIHRAAANDNSFLIECSTPKVQVSNAGHAVAKRYIVGCDIRLI